MHSKKILIIGPIPIVGIESTIGGSTVLMKSFVEYCKTNDINYDFIQSNKYLGYFATIKRIGFIFIQIMLKIHSAQIIMLNATLRPAFFLSPLLLIFSRVFKKKIVFRKFGGNFHLLYQNSPNWKKKIVKYGILNADLIFFETIEMVTFFKKLVVDKNKVHWFPNVRKKTEVSKQSNNYQRRFVFISHVKRTKGIFEIRDAAKRLSDEYTIDVYGPITDKIITKDVFSNCIVKYKGTLQPQEVILTLAQYDILLLPTYHPGEGYPGIIIEALSLGIPVISTNWNAIPEIIENGREGLLIEPQNSPELYKAITSITNKNYFEFSKNAFVQFGNFEEKTVYENVIKIMMEK
ncbi:glycosyltransferase [Mesohalobacter halotolerans]|uniref:Glycosyltransferase family 4 protein n=1 Tax=Mesohalobacter halotolerans TaxID=1883405 RepID=A0A4U5TSA4_9FLAO|nr:glycosyltransferase [Mesohalobacter halotolerans]TKS56983.1 glycosyltransferase family 4 protein [Mesohalobacter halotolerans]